MTIEWTVYRPTITLRNGNHKVTVGRFVTEAGDGEDPRLEDSASLALDLAIKKRKEGRSDREAAVAGTWIVVAHATAFAFEVKPPPPPPVQPAYSRTVLR